MRTALIPKFIPPFKGGVAPDSLLTGLESYWTLDELSGVRADSVGSNDLSDNNTVTYVNDGPRGVNAKFVAASTEYLVGPSAPDAPHITTIFSLSAWVKQNAGSYCIAKYTGVGSGGLGIFINLSGPNPILYMNTAGTISASFAASSGDWHHLIVLYNGSGPTNPDKLKIFYDGVAQVLTFVGIIPTDYNANISPWSFGATGDASGGIDGNVSRVGIWSDILSAGEIVELYNSGRGKSYSDLSAGIKTNLVSYWNLDESGGNRADSHGVNTLTDNNTVIGINIGPEQVVANFSAATNEYLSCAAPPVNPSASNYTYAGWTRIVEDQTYPFTMVAGHYLYYITGFGGVLLLKDVAGNQVFTTEGNIADGRWIFWVATFNTSTGAATLRCFGGESAGAVSAGVLNADNASGSEFRIGIQFGGADYANQREARVGAWSRILTALEITELFNSGVGKKYSELSAGIQTNLQRYWDLTEASGNRDNFDFDPAKQLTDNNTVLSVINMPDVADKIAGKFDSALTEYLSRVNQPVLAGSFTISGWFRCSDVTGVGLITRGNAWPNNVNYALYTSGDNLTALVGNGAAFNFAQILIFDNTTYHFVMWYDGVNVRLELNNDGNIVAAAIAGPPYSGAGDFTLGANLLLVIYQWGWIDEVAMWSRVLTPAERARLFNLGKGYFYPFVP